MERVLKIGNRFRETVSDLSSIRIYTFIILTFIRVEFTSYSHVPCQDGIQESDSRV